MNANKLFPTIIEYQPYSICNANCVYCPVGSINRAEKTKGTDSNDAVFEELLKQTRGRKLERISPHLNCEPLLCKSLPDQVKKWKEEHPEAEVEFSTNGVFLKEEIFLKLAESKLDILSIHFMGLGKEFHENAMNTNYDIVYKNIKNILKLKKEKNIGIEINLFGHRLRGSTLREWYEYAQTWKAEGAKVTVGPLWNRAGYYGDKFDEISVGLRTVTPAPCSKPVNQLAVENDGNVVLCSLDYEHQVKIGNIFNESLEDIWNGSVMKTYRENQAPEKVHNLLLCKDCIRGGRYLLNETFITKVINSELPKETSKSDYLGYLDMLDKM